MHLLRSTLLALVAATTTLSDVASAGSSEWVVGQKVGTTSGTIVGHGSPWQPLVSEYFGIRYAKPPVGKLRFSPPEPYRSYEVYEASTMGDSCPSPNWENENKTIDYETVGTAVKDQLLQHGESFSEDCLSLSIWTRPQLGEKKKAVLFWVHGGGFSSGSQAHPVYNGAKLANDHDVVVVLINYRLNIFGFPGADFLDTNLGLSDLRLAVEWARDNIEEFGGDPDRITLFGQSAGGSVVDGYTYKWTEDPIINGVIMQSGMVPPWNSSITRKDSSDFWYYATNAMGCGDADDGEATGDCMREKPWQEVVKLADFSTLGAFVPTPDEDTFFFDPLSRLKAGKFIKTPILVGTTDDEHALYEFLGIPETFTKDLPCASRILAESRMMHHLPAWHYTYAGDWPNQNLGVGGAWHASEIGMIFDTHEILSRHPATSKERFLSWQMGKAWSDFAKDPYNGLSDFRWPEFDISDRTRSNIVLGGKMSSEIKFEHNNARVEHCKGDRRPF